MAHCTTGAIPTYGDEFDFAYTVNTGWNQRRDSLLGEGPITLAATHYFNTVLKTPLSDASAGRKHFSYMKLEGVAFSALADNFTAALLTRTQLFSLKLHIFSKLLKELHDAGTLPRGCYEWDELSALLRTALCFLPADLKIVDTKDIVPCAASPPGNECIFEFVTVQQLMHADLHGGAVIRQFRNMLVGAWLVSERQNPDGISAAVCRTMGPTAARTWTRTSDR